MSQNSPSHLHPNPSNRLSSSTAQSHPTLPPDPSHLHPNPSNRPSGSTAQSHPPFPPDPFTAVPPMQAGVFYQSTSLNSNL